MELYSAKKSLVNQKYIYLYKAHCKCINNTVYEVHIQSECIYIMFYILNNT